MHNNKLSGFAAYVLDGNFAVTKGMEEVQELLCQTGF